MSPNKHIWDQWGLTEEGAELADKVMPHVLSVLQEHPDAVDILDAVVGQAFHQLNELPERTPEYREKWTWKPVKEPE